MRFVVLLFVALVALACGCVSPSGTELCEDAAANQCATWRDCFCPDGSCSHAGVDLAEGSCEAELSDSCTSQASTLELPDAEVELCADALDTWTCEDVRAANVQDRATTPPACTYYF